MIISVTKISQKIKSKSLLSIEKTIYYNLGKYKKFTFYEHGKLFSQI